MTRPPEDLSQRLQSVLGSQYRLERELGRGGMGVVFLAQDTTLDRPVAVKVVHPELAVHPSIAQRFLAEARMIARLRHPNLVAVHSAGQADDLLYYVMDHVSGETLRERLNREGRLAPEQVRRIAADIAQALDVAGRAGLVHRDVKPENILLERDTDRALLVDFGIARAAAAESGAQITGQGMVIGTPVYMSPEQAAGEEVDGRSDLYALGLVCYEMLTGQPPFTGPNRVVVSRQISERPVELSKVAADCPPALAGAVMHTLEKNPADRWQTGQELHSALLGGRPATRRPPLRRRVVLGVSAVVLAAVATLAVATRGASGPPPGVNPRHSILVLPFVNLRQEPEVDWLRDGSVNMLGLNLSQWSDLSVVDDGRVHDLLSQHEVAPDAVIGLELARRLAREAGVWTVVMGDFARAGDSLLLTARVYDVASGSRVDVARVEGRPGDDLRPLFDRLAADILDLSGAPGSVRVGVAEATTSSLEAYRAYLRGVESLNRWDLGPARRELERAVVLDSTFGLAYYRLALTRGWLLGTGDTESERAMVRAVAHSDNLPEHDRTLIKAYAAFIRGSLPEARALYQQLLVRDPGDADAWYGLGDAWFHDTREGLAPSRTQAYRAFKRALALDPNYLLAYDHLNPILQNAGRSDGALAMLPGDSFVSRYRTDRRPTLDSLQLAAAMTRARTEAIRVAQRWVTSQPGARRSHEALVDAFVVNRDWPAALSEIARYRQTPSSHPELPFVEARVRFAAGDVEQAAASLRTALDSVPPEQFGAGDGALTVVQDVMSAANVFAYQGDLASAVKAIEYADRVRTTLDPNPPEGRDSYKGQGWQREYLAHLYAAVGAPGPALRRVWDGAAEAGRLAPAADRAWVVRTGGPAALALAFWAANPDTSVVREFTALTGEPAPREMQALLAMYRGDFAQARDILARPVAGGDPDTGEKHSWSSPYGRPIEAQANIMLGDYRAALRLLEDYQPERLRLEGFDLRWGLLGRVRMLRAESYLALGRRAEAEAEYRQVLDQYKSRDPSVMRWVQLAEEQLARLTAAG